MTAIMLVDELFTASETMVFLGDIIVHTGPSLFDLSYLLVLYFFLGWFCCGTGRVPL